MPLKPEAALRKDKTNAKGDVFQHRHFAVIAGILSELDGDSLGVSFGGIAKRAIFDHFADHLADTNPRFDRNRFLAACHATAD